MQDDPPSDGGTPLATKKRRPCSQSKTANAPPAVKKRLLQSARVPTQSVWADLTRQASISECALKQETPPMKTITFAPVGTSWQRKCTGAFFLRIQCNLESNTMTIMTIPVDQKPHNAIFIRGDGNSLFRTFSSFLTGVQNDYSALRQSIVNFMGDHEQIIDDLPYCEDYINTSNMATSTVWGTEIEIFTFASMVSTPIYIYGILGRVGNQILFKRLQYMPVKGTEPLVTSSTDKSMYISNVCSHFQPVFKVWTPPF